MAPLANSGVCPLANSGVCLDTVDDAFMTMGKKIVQLKNTLLESPRLARRFTSVWVKIMTVVDAEAWCFLSLIYLGPLHFLFERH